VQHTATPTHLSPARVVVAFAALYLIWGSTYLAIQKAAAALPTLLMVGSRFIVAGSLLLLWAFASGRVRPGDLNRRTWSAATIVGFGLMLIGNAGVAFAVQRIPTGISAVIVALTPMWLVLFDWMQHRQRRPTNAVILGIVLGVAGIITLKFGEAGSANQLDLVGVLLNIVATLGWAAASIWGRTAARASSPVTTCAMQMLAGGAIVLALSPFFEEWSSVRVTELPASFWWSWSYLVVFGSLFGFTAYIWLLQHVSAAKVGTYAYVNPIVALAIGIMLNGEKLTGARIVACALILVGVIVITLFRGRNANAAATAGSSRAAPPPDPDPNPARQEHRRDDVSSTAS
jgi:drug/metabolite transporter (DMT)-like permease